MATKDAVPLVPFCGCKGHHTPGGCPVPEIIERPPVLCDRCRRPVEDSRHGD
jgi:hypothetical protein